MTVYYLRCLPTEYDDMVQQCVKDGLISFSEDPMTGENKIIGNWDYIGEIHKPTGKTKKLKNMPPMMITKPLTDDNGIPYIHVNVLSDVTAINKYMMDAPSNPSRVFAGV